MGLQVGPWCGLQQSEGVPEEQRQQDRMFTYCSSTLIRASWAADAGFREHM